MTDVGTTKRKAMSPTRRLRLFEAHNGIYCLCLKKIDGVHEKWTIEHLRALGLGGEDADSNCAPAHEDCRRVKDKDDVERIAKAKRVKQKHIGIRTAPAKKLNGPGFPVSEKSASRSPKQSLGYRALYRSVEESR
jgi:hypothetical protein